MWPFAKRTKPQEPQSGNAHWETHGLSDGYRVFTREFDEVITVPQLAARLEPLSPEQQQEYARNQKLLAELFAFERLSLMEFSALFIRSIISTFTADERKRSVVSLLVDHSGSMNGIRIVSAMIAAQNALAALSQCGMKCEIIGYTTKSWRGGQSRAKWSRSGKPPNPGRLCDLRYILYHEALKPSRPLFSEALYPNLLKENIDGEALEFAASRLPAADWERRAIVFLSDGAPSDDSTLAANQNSKMLVNHLLSVEQALAEEGLAVGYLLLEERAGYRKFSISALGYEPLTAGKALLDVIAKTLGASAAR